MVDQRIILVEDEPDMADLVATRLTREGYKVEVARDGEEGLEMVRSSPPDLLLLDVMLPRMSGIDIVKALRDDPRTSAIPIIMVTARGDETDIVLGLRFGADDYVTKPFSMPVLIARIDAVLRRSTFALTPARGVMRIGALEIDHARHSVEVGGQPVSLTLTEFKLLSALAGARGRVLTRNQLLDQTVGMDSMISDRAIDVHIVSLRRKLVRLAKCVETVRGRGYRLDVDAAKVS